jgi:hypothetical protein
LLQDTTELRLENAVDKTMDPTYEDAEDVKEILGVSWIKKDKRGKGSLKENIATKWIPQTRKIRSMPKRLQEDQRKNGELSHALKKPTKKQKVQTSKSNPRSTPEFDESKQVFYEYLESMEMLDRSPPSINDKEASPNNNINKNDFPTTMDCEKQDIPVGHIVIDMLSLMSL